MSNEGEKARVSGEVSRPEPTLPTVNPAAEKSEPPKPTFHPAVYVSVWIALSSSVILFNKHILDYAQFRFPIILTTWHLAFATFMTQVLARTTTLLDGRKTVKMTGRVYLRAIVPIGLFFSLSLICGNVTYLYLSVAFIQMLKATTPVAVLLATWAMGMAPVNLKVLFNVAIIVVGVVIASFGEIKFVFIGFMFQIGGIVFEATRLVMVQRLLSSAEFKMDPLVSLYYFAPVCAVMNGVTALFVEVPNLTMGHIYNVGVWTLLANAVVAFLLNVSVVFLIGKTSSLVMTLCGVLKDILLVAASMMIWQTPVTPLQFFGYSIALIGLVYYKLGGDKIREYAGQANRSWAEYGANHPAQRKSIIIGAVVLIFFLLIGSMAPSYAPESVDKVKGMLGGATAGNA
ncbi:probable sugar phosphate/phosphate translocator At4g32390 [Aspergillus lentulus]|uniref:Probable sugar phosphate/phosphate translocator At4g32390 n=1 Tax=Aspergillus lentulus TaxID=293939 RepID=A0ABQ1ANL1_ASPLE|nr:probable sugar phosphate/phosphate translocator At4g32390 [Aspergillus lentulus]GFF85028.1 probable sugar phosphate/phosphate translocator At4g32390 [Aspergillus lentulus]GFG11071.1 probable sugar phosphate/phosphate translocator At4g32390 [Aspergillus lentulus]